MDKTLRPRDQPAQKIPREQQPRVNWKALDEFVDAQRPTKPRQSKVTGTSIV